MKAEECKIGLVVHSAGDRDSLYTIRSMPDSNDKVKVSWETYQYTDNTTQLHLNELTCFDVEADKVLGKQIQEKLDQATDAFEKAFQALSAAQEIASKNKVDFYMLRDDNLVDASKLEKMVDSNGWRSSSLWC